MIRTLLVGFGFSASTFHLPFLTQLANYTIVGVVSSRPQAVLASLPGIPVIASLEEALSELTPDLTIITTPNWLHAQQAQQAIVAGSHVLVEKPFTLSSADAKNLTALADANGKQLSVYQNRRFDGDFLTVKSLIQAGRFGHVRRYFSRFDRFRPTPRDRWRENAGPGSGILWDLGPHLIDQAVQLFGLPETVSAEVQTLRSGGESNDSFDLRLRYSNTLVSLGSSPFQANKNLRFEIQGESGSFRKFGLDPQESQLKAGVPIDSSMWGLTPEHEHGEFCSDSECTQVTTCEGRYQEFYQKLASSLQSQTNCPGSASSVMPVIKIIELALKSATLESVEIKYGDG